MNFLQGLSISLILVVILSGCITANPVEKYYQSTKIPPDVAVNIFEVPSDNPQIMHTSDFETDIKKILADGYAAIGSSEFTWSNSPSEIQIINQARSIEADLILYQSHYNHTEMGMTPMLGVIPGSTNISTTSGNANIYGTGSSSASSFGPGGMYVYGSSLYSGSGYGSYHETTTTTTAPNYYTYYVPYERHVNYYGMIFFRKVKPHILGVHVSFVDEELSKSLGQNTGALVTVVIKDSPAFYGNILIGDVITRVGAYDINSPSDLEAALTVLANTETDIVFIRDGILKKVALKLNKNYLCINNI